MTNLSIYIPTTIPQITHSCYSLALFSASKQVNACMCLMYLGWTMQSGDDPRTHCIGLPTRRLARGRVILVRYYHPMITTRLAKTPTRLVRTHGCNAMHLPPMCTFKLRLTRQGCFPRNSNLVLLTLAISPWFIWLWLFGIASNTTKNSVSSSVKEIVQKITQSPIPNHDASQAYPIPQPYCPVPLNSHWRVEDKMPFSAAAEWPISNPRTVSKLVNGKSSTGRAPPV
ncbi:hypothetical protein F4818DRAFT_138876 [Hypoxylon cercidicola]|nr:hypothetical protein F4818DRAFT_138876 [Hypoxylon cercidicola]